MANEQDEEIKISLTYSTNANDTSKAVNTLGNAIDDTTESQKKSNTETKKTEDVNKTMKTQLREATNELHKLSQAYGDTSKEAVGAAKRVAELKDQIEFSKDLVEGFNPDRKFQALSTAVNMAATAATGLTAGMALFGGESEDTQKALLKVQSAMAFSDSIGRITEMGDDFAKLKAQVVSMFTAMVASKTADTVATEANVVAENQSFLAKTKSTIATGAMTAASSVATAAQWLWNAAIMANPVVAIAVAIAAAVAGIYLLTKALMDSSAESEKASKANTALNKDIDNLTKSSAKSSEQMEINNDQTIALARASGKSSEEIRKLTLQLANQEVTEKRVNAVKAYSILLEAQRVAGLEDSTDAQKETAKKALESYKAINTDYEKSLKDRNQIIRNNKVEEVQEETDKQRKLQESRDKANQERAKKEQEAADKRIAKAIKEAEDEKKRLADIKKAKLDAEMASAKEAISIVDALNKAKETPAQKEQREYEEKKAVLEANNVSTVELTNQHNETMAQIDLDYWAAESEKATERTAKSLSDEQALADGKNAIQNAQLDNVSKGVSLLQSLGIKNKAVQKGLVIAENAAGIAKTIINTMAANAKALTLGPVLAPPTIAANNISAAIGVATSVAATAKAMTALGGGGSDGGGGAVSTPAGSAGGSAAPQVGFQSSNANQIATTIADNTNKQEPVKAFVVANEVTTAQSLNRNKIDANSI